MIIPGRLSQPSLLIVDNTRSLSQIGAPERGRLGLTHSQTLECGGKACNGKHCSLFQTFGNYKDKSFITLAPGDIMQVFFLLSTSLAS
jgi:hypothetical protein